jgi:hypothetical protein
MMHVNGDVTMMTSEHTKLFDGLTDEREDLIEQLWDLDAINGKESNGDRIDVAVLMMMKKIMRNPADYDRDEIVTWILSRDEPELKQLLDLTRQLHSLNDRELAQLVDSVCCRLTPLN